MSTCPPRPAWESRPSARCWPTPWATASPGRNNQPARAPTRAAAARPPPQRRKNGPAGTARSSFTWGSGPRPARLPGHSCAGWWTRPPLRPSCWRSTGAPSRARSGTGRSPLSRWPRSVMRWPPSWPPRPSARCCRPRWNASCCASRSTTPPTSPPASSSRPATTGWNLARGTASGACPAVTRGSMPRRSNGAGRPASASTRPRSPPSGGQNRPPKSPGRARPRLRSPA